MSELKEVMNVMQVSGERIPSGYYKKCEVDAVLAEKDEEIQRLENLCESYRIDCDNLAIREANAYKAIERDNKQIRHHKYKRCLAMAMWCKAEAEINHNSAYEASEYLPSREDYFRRRAEHYERWQKRWLELAEQFKDKEEAK